MRAEKLPGLVAGGNATPSRVEHFFGRMDGVLADSVWLEVHGAGRGFGGGLSRTVSWVGGKYIFAVLLPIWVSSRAVAH